VGVVNMLATAGMITFTTAILGVTAGMNTWSTAIAGVVNMLATAGMSCYCHSSSGRGQTFYNLRYDTLLPQLLWAWPTCWQQQV
jgi:hypothetical protein